MAHLHSFLSMFFSLLKMFLPALLPHSYWSAAAFSSFSSRCFNSFHAQQPEFISTVRRMIYLETERAKTRSTESGGSRRSSRSAAREATSRLFGQSSVSPVYTRLQRHGLRAEWESLARGALGLDSSFSREGKMEVEWWKIDQAEEPSAPAASSLWPNQVW